MAQYSQDSREGLRLRRRVWVAAPLLPAALLSAVGAGASFSLNEIAIASFAVQVVAALYLVKRLAPRTMSLLGLFAVVWLVYFPLRLALLTVSRRSPFYYDTVNQLTDAGLAKVWLLLAASFVLFTFGATCVSRRLTPKLVPRHRRLSHSEFIAIAVIGLFVGILLQFSGASSGLLGNVAAISVVGIAGASYLERRESHGTRFTSLVLAIMATLLGYQSGSKETALLPAAAWVIGRIIAGGRMRLRYIALSALLVSLAFGAVQGQRSASAYGRSIQNPNDALVAGLSEFDIATGVPQHYAGLGILRNLLKGVLFRLKGADYFISISARVPVSTPFQRGQSLWQPSLSIVPGNAVLFDLKPEYRQLSLGRFVTQTFIADNASDDRSAQSMTYPGDLYLNFGSIGVLVGMTLLGALFRLIDNALQAADAMTAGVLSYVGLTLVAVDRNIAYVLVTSTLRLAILNCLLIVFLRRRRSTRLPFVRNHPCDPRPRVGKSIITNGG